MGQFVLYKSKKQYVAPTSTIPKCVMTYLDDIGYIPDGDYVGDYLEGQVTEGDITYEDRETILKFLKDNDLFEYDIDMEYD